MGHTENDVNDCIIWVMVAHMLVRPGLIEALRILVCTRGLRPTKDGIVEVVEALARRHGLVPSRTAAGQRTWGQIDVFCVASTQSIGAKYCGSKRLKQQLQNFDAMVRIATGLAALWGIAQRVFRFSAIVSGRFWSAMSSLVVVPPFSSK